VRRKGNVVCHVVENVRASTLIAFDKLARKQYVVEPRQFEERLLHHLPLIRTPYGDAYAELYLAEPTVEARVALTRAGTRVIEDIASLPELDHEPWTSRYVQGLIDVPFLDLTPGTRSGIIRDECYAALVTALKPMEASGIEEQQRAEEEQASQQSLRASQRAFHEALLALPRDRSRRRVQGGLAFHWEILEGGGSLQGDADQEVGYRSPAVPTSRDCASRSRGGRPPAVPRPW
jgi:hypothetical protein